MFNKSTFGTPASSTGSVFGGGTTTGTKSLFGNTAASTGTSLFGNSTSTAASTGGSLFGTTTSSTGSAFNFNTTKPATGGLFGTPATTTASGGLFGNTGGTSGGLFGNTSTNTGSSLFGNTSNTGGSSLFGNKSGTSLFGNTSTATGTTSLFGSQPSTGGTSLFGNNQQQTSGGLFGNTQQQQQQQQQPGGTLTDLNSLATVAQALSLPIICGDERDMLYAKFNQLQAYWGHGTVILNQSGNTFPITPESPFSRFKSVGYCRLPSTKNEDGLVGIFIGKPLDDVTKNQTQLVASLHSILGGKQEHVVCCDSVKSINGTTTEVVIYVLLRSPTGATQRIPATDLASVLTSTNIANQLKSQMFVTNVISKVAFTSSQLSLYLDKPPVGISPVLWEQAKQENPDPVKLIPVPLVGFKAISERLRLQKEQSEAHFARVELIGKEVEDIRAVQANTLSRLQQLKRKHSELTHRVLQVMVDVEVQKKAGFSLQPEEEQLRVQLESIQQELNAPNLFKGRLSEMLSLIRMQSLSEPGNKSSTQMDNSVLTSIHSHLSRQQEGISHLLDIIRDDLQHLDIIKQGLAEKVAS